MTNSSNPSIQVSLNYLLIKTFILITNLLIAIMMVSNSLIMLLEFSLINFYIIYHFYFLSSFFFANEFLIIFILQDFIIINKAFNSYNHYLNCKVKNLY